MKMKTIVAVAAMATSVSSFACGGQFGVSEKLFKITKVYDYDINEEREVGSNKYLCTNKRLQKLLSGDREVKLTFKLNKPEVFVNYEGKTPTATAESIAGILIGHFSLEPVEEVKPCGVMTEGSYDYTKSKNRYTVKGSGDGIMNTCTGEGYPGGWEHTLDIKYNPSKNEGTIYYSHWTE